jgi:murein DD-endopeptidase MepM/ murein hydrolase activator NlpD
MNWFNYYFKRGVLLFMIFVLGLPLSGQGQTSSSSLTESTTSAAPTTASSTAPEIDPEEVARQQLQFEIRKKNFELDAIKAAILKNEEALSKTQGQKTSLQKELNALRSQQTILTKKIQEDQVSLDKLGLEIKSLTYDLQDIQDGIVSKRHAIQEVLKIIQRSESVNMITIILRNNSLAEGIAEIKNLFDLNTRLTADIKSFKKLNAEYSGKLQNLNEKQEQVESQSFNLKNRKVILANQEGQRQALLKETKNQEAIFQDHLRGVTAQQEAIAAEIEALDAKLRGQIDYGQLPTSGKLFILPVSGGSTTQGYGATAFAKYGYRGKWHNGIDLRASIGTSIIAAADGRVVSTGDQDRYCPKGSYGKFIVLSHNNKMNTLYAHLSRIVVSAGETVRQGQTIGYSGSTGYATGPHLHFTVYDQSTFKMGGSKSCGPMPQGGDLNPLKYL